MNRDAVLLRLLREAQVHLLPGELAAAAKCSLAELEHTLAELRTAGFDIESRPGFGWRLLASPDRLIADDLFARLGGDAPVREILAFEETSSTNDVAARLGREGHEGGVAVFAERQTAGRGRFGRRWESAPRSGLWMSLLIRPRWPAAQWPRLTTAAGVAVAAVCGEKARIKWPNDVQLGGRKVCGILVESATDAAGRAFAVVGIGVNVNQAEFPAELAESATSLRLARGEIVDRPALAAALLRSFGEWFARCEGEFPSVLAEAARRSSLLGTWVRLRSGALEHEGVAEALDAEGNLLLRQADGTLARMTAGEVTTRG